MTNEQDDTVCLRDVATAVVVAPRAPTPDLLYDLTIAAEPHGVDTQLVLKHFGLKQAPGVSLLFNEGFSRGTLVPGYFERPAGNGLVAVLYRDRWPHAFSLPLDDHTRAYIALGLRHPRAISFEDENLISYHWGNSYFKDRFTPDDILDHLCDRWSLGDPRAIAACVLGRMPDQVLEIDDTTWLLTEEEEKAR